MKKVIGFSFVFLILLVGFVSASSINVGFSVKDGDVDSGEDYNKGSSPFAWLFYVALVVGVVFVLYKYNYLSSKKKKKRSKKKR